MSEQKKDDFDKSLDSGSKALDAMGDAFSHFGRGILAKSKEGLNSVAEIADNAKDTAVWTYKQAIDNTADNMLAVANKRNKLKKDVKDTVVWTYNQAIDNTSDNMLATADKASQLKKEVTGVWSGLAAVVNRGGKSLARRAGKLGDNIMDAASENIIKPVKVSVQKKYESVEKRVTNKINQTKAEVAKVVDSIDKGVKNAKETVVDAHGQAVKWAVDTAVKIGQIYNEWKDPEKFAQEQKQAKAREVAAKTPAPKKPAQSSSKT